GLVRALLLPGVAGVLLRHGRQCQPEQQCTAQAAQTDDANPVHAISPRQSTVRGTGSPKPGRPKPDPGPATALGHAGGQASIPQRPGRVDSASSDSSTPPRGVEILALSRNMPRAPARDIRTGQAAWTKPTHSS